MAEEGGGWWWWWWWAEEGGGRAIFPLDTFIKILTIAILSYFVTRGAVGELSCDKRGEGWSR